MNVLSLFDGMSCGQIALERAGIKVDNYFASEIEKAAIEVTMKNYPNTKQLGDVTKIKAEDLPQIDLLIGGSPCQGFSFAGKQLNFEDERSKLFFEFVRLLKECKPKYFLLENVKMKKEWQEVISEHLGVEPIRINSSLVSAAKRDRLYWTNIPNVKQPIDKGITFDDINTNSKNWIDKGRITKIEAWKAQQKPLKNATKIGECKKLPCLTARGYNQYHSGMILITDGEKYRYLTNEEAEAAHTIPIGYTKGMTDREISHMIGNGWTVDVIAHIFNQMAATADKEGREN
jgi:DNA (cytosine-5)-methyltransferase 3A